MNDIVVIIPAYKPDKKIMFKFMKELMKSFENIIIVDDGSGPSYQSQFDEYEKMGIPILRHHINMGKGRALKTAFNYCLNEYPNMVGCVTADSDGQHTVEDITHCVEALKDNPQRLIIGTRNFDLSNVPFRSRFGNILTRNMFKVFVGIRITDTQSGLRAFGRDVIKEFLTTSGERYEYETNVLIDCKEKNIEIEEVPIETVYINDNKSSHFNPIRDSYLIYKLFFKYVMASLSSFLLDIVLFTILANILPEIEVGIITTIITATVLARIISSSYNFLINSKVVFKNMDKFSMFKYFLLVLIQMFASGFAVSAIFRITNLNATMIKVFVDIVIFIINFVVQREWVFNTKKNKHI